MTNTKRPLSRGKEKNIKTVISGSSGMVRVIILVLLLGAVSGCASQGSTPGGNVLTDSLSEPLNGATTAKFDINVGDGNLTIDRLTGGEQLLAGGTLQYLENQGLPTRTLVSFLDQATLTLKASSAGQPWFRLPWAACNAATEWLIHLNPAVSYDITARSDGGNVKLNLADMAVTRVSADTGGGNMDVVLPDNAASLDVTAKTGAGNLVVDIGRDITGNNTINANSGAGNVVVRIPSDIPARIHVTGGLGKAILVSRFGKIDDNTYQSPGYDGAGNVSVNTK